MTCLTGAVLWAALVWVEQAQQPADTVQYRLVESSRFDVLTRRAGLFGFAGHNHLVRVAPGGFEGDVLDVPGNRSASRVHLAIAADSLRVLTAADPEDIPKITNAMREKVLQVERHPTVEFVSTGARVIEGGVELTGDLTLVGRTRPVSVDVFITVRRDTLRARGRFSVKQRDFGIDPYSTALGTVQVADQITFDFEAVAVIRTRVPE